MDDLKQRLRYLASGRSPAPMEEAKAILTASAAALDALEAENARLRDEVERLQLQLDIGPLGRMGLTLRTRKALSAAGIKTPEKLRQMDDATLLRIPNLGRKGLRDIHAALTGQ